MLTLGKLYERAVLIGLYQDIRSSRLLKHDYTFLRTEDSLASILHDRTECSLTEFLDRYDGVLTPAQIDAMYPDSGIQYGEPTHQIERMLVGIDCDTSELRAAKTELECDVVVGHHPVGRALMRLTEVMTMYQGFFSELDYTMSKIQTMNDRHRRKILNRLLSENYGRTVEHARMMKVPLLNLHTPADSSVQRFMADRLLTDSTIFGMCRLNDGLAQLKDLVSDLSTIEEMQRAKEEYGVAPYTVVGNSDGLVDRMFIAMTGGTNTCSELETSSLDRGGISTVLAMHATTEFITECEKRNLNLVCSTHMPSDTIGMNRLFDFLQIEEHGIEIVECSSYRRIRRANTLPL